MKAWPLLALLLPLAAPAFGQSERDAAAARRENVAREIDEASGARAEAQSRAASLAKDVDRLRAEMKRAADSVKAKRRAARAAQAEADAAAEAAEAARAAIAKRRRELAGLLGAMARLSLRPGEALAALKDGPTEAARASLAFKALAPEIERRIAGARDELAAAAALRDAEIARLAEARAAAAALAEERRALDAAVKAKRRLMRKAEAEDTALAGQVEKLAREAKSLDAFFAALTAREAAVKSARQAEAARRLREIEAARAAARAEAARRALEPGRAAEPSAPAPAAPPQAPAPGDPPLRLAGLAARQGQATAPVDGRLAATFGEGAGVLSRGWVFAADDAAEVFAPYDGRIAYAGPFRGYGTVALINHGGGYHTLLTGLEKLDVRAGDWVLQGEPLGALPTRPTAENGGGASDQGGAKLYVELRKDGEPVDPAPWFARPT